MLLLLGKTDGFSRGPPSRSSLRGYGAPRPRCEALHAAKPDLSTATASLVELPVMFASDEMDFDFARWERHRATTRYGRLIAGTFAGETTRRILPALSTLFLVASVVYVYNTLASGGAYNYDARNLGDLAALDVLLPELQLPDVPFELSSPVLG